MLCLQRPGQDAVAELGDLHAVLDDDGVLADEIDAADMAVEIDAHAGPVEPRRHLLDMGRFAGAVIALDHHPAVVREAGEDGERRLAVEQIVRIEIRHMLVGSRIGRHFEIAVDAEDLAHGNLHVRQAGGLLRGGHGGGHHQSSVVQGAPRTGKYIGLRLSAWFEPSREPRPAKPVTP